MEKQKVQLPPLHQPIKSSRISNFEDYAKWEKQKKQAYRDQLRLEIFEKDLSRDYLVREKEKERSEINSIVKSQKQRKEVDKYTKMKTEQKYMKDNWKLAEETSKVFAPKKLNNPEEYREHPFVRLVDQEERRKIDTKNNFIFQNKLNDIQSEMRKEQSIKRKQFECEQRKKYEDHIEEEYRRKRKEREQFENRYLKIDKSSNKSDVKKEYLDYLKAQLVLNHSQHKRNQGSSEAYEVNPASPGSIGLSPAASDRIKQLQTIEKSLKMFPQANRSRNYSSYLENSYLPQQQQTISAKRAPASKLMTERAPIQNNTQHFETMQNRSEKYVVQPIKSLLSQRLEKPSRLARQYKQYNIINGGERVFIK